MSRDYTKIKAWVLADELAVQVYGVTHGFPGREVFGLIAQLRRAASSVPANIAEGSNRASKKEYLQFLSVASGSTAEVKYFLHLSKRLGYLTEIQYAAIGKLAEETSKTLAGLISSIRQEV